MENLKKYFCKCRKCGEYNGVIKKKEYYGDDLPKDEDGEEFIMVSCLCSGILCPKCKENKINRPISNSYCPESSTIEHRPWLMGMMSCHKCKEKEKN